MTAAPLKVDRIDAAAYRVQHDGLSDLVYVARSADRAWAFWNGRVFELDTAARAGTRRSLAGGANASALTAPMPGTVIGVRVKPGDAVKKGETVVLMEAMKMELPILAPSDAVVRLVRCREGDLVQHNQVLVELQ